MNPTLMKWLSIALGILAVLVGVYGKGRLDERELFNAFKREVAAAGKAQEAKNESIQKQQALVNKGVRDEYEARLAAVRAYYGRLQYRSGGGSMSPVPNPTNGTNAVSANDLPVDANLLLQCTETTLMLTSLQKWIENASQLP